MSLKDRKRLIIIVTIVILAFAIMTYQYRTQRIFHLKFLSYPFDLLNSISTNIRHSISKHFDVLNENARLKEQVNKLLIERYTYAEIIEENKRLHSLLDFKPSGYHVVAYAKIIGRSYDKVLNLIKLDKGSSSGIKKDMAVITTNGLIGKIYNVHDNYSEVLLLKDNNFSLAVRIQNSRVEGILSGTGFYYLLLNFIPPEEKVEKGDIIVSSGLDGLFPSGIPIGVVNSVNNENIEFFKFIKVIPFQNDIKAEEVFVVTKKSY